ncbi:MAG: hypothetical protein CMB80_05255 [Flammeovirgaceae bacterium]|nr:hypothetical protein [Flammeovirgaceae bacterium]|tara:strand:+ start:1027 stop:1734 length:708 start_codon:yes stop_codon:yes gene_type:complete
MGFLDNSTNNILIDAVLTDDGRRALALNNGSFSIVKFALGDDEVDYGIIRKYGTLVGKEKIIKNTPVTEAQTRSSLAIKHRLLGLSSNTLLRLPSLSTTLQGGNAVLAMTVSSNVNGNQKQITIEQAIENQTSIPPELIDGLFEVKMQNRFLFVPGQTPIVDTDNMATYLMNSAGTPTPKGGSQLIFNVATRPINQFSVFATYADKSVIKTYVEVKGFFSGASSIIEVQISNTTA